MFKEDKPWMILYYWWKYKPEDELYYKMEKNPCYPFKEIADGYYYAVVQSDRAAYGICFLLHGRGSYMLRVLQNQEKLIQHDLRNVYIRLTRKDDVTGDPYFWLNLSGYELDDYRITRMTKAEGPLRIMGMKLAYRLGINYFDWKDESEEHLVFHYKSYSRLTHMYQDKTVVVDAVGEGNKSVDSGVVGLLTVPSRKGKNRNLLGPDAF